MVNFKRGFSINFQTRKRKFQDIFDEIYDNYSKNWQSGNDEDDEDH